jgi:hypothetical protein
MGEKLAYERYFSKIFALSVSASFHQCSIKYFIHLLSSICNPRLTASLNKTPKSSYTTHKTCKLSKIFYTFVN